ncbi:MAG TPA: hypothetical protein VHG72_11055 [Polyangia bacterium]|nr:hypothetical protein [Polyangia bacterium]
MLEAARALPVASAPEEMVPARPGIPTWAEALAQAAAHPRAEATAQLPPGVARPADLRRDVAWILARLARRADAALATGLGRAGQSWEQVDALAIVDYQIEGDLAVTRRRLAAAAHVAAPAAQRAVALEGLLAVDAAIALARLFERRLASLLRLRLRSSTRDLLPQGRPFLDLGAALHEAAEAWR